ncbi:hypothetical protein BDN70DRAFT_364300 [Pholiota conissans]|uniref:Uncharacterized protein n=1 Tax=Pholiota conissans TaxID=109636 RepID=A0A9P5YQM5_9AGAR|nr:hypothetical protein BDN70DRAFT_364300 [Pholiota conissans]
MRNQPSIWLIPSLLSSSTSVPPSCRRALLPSPEGCSRRLWQHPYVHLSPPMRDAGRLFNDDDETRPTCYDAEQRRSTMDDDGSRTALNDGWWRGSGCGVSGEECVCKWQRGSGGKVEDVRARAHTERQEREAAGMREEYERGMLPCSLLLPSSLFVLSAQ